MASISFMMRPEAGHILPTLRLAAFLRASGHEICYVTLPQFKSLFDRLGFPCLTVAFEDADDSPMADIWNPPSSVRTLQTTLERQFRQGALAWQQTLLQALAASVPDLVVCDATFADALVAPLGRVLRGPLVLLAPYPPVRPPFRVPELVLCPVEFTLPDERGWLDRGRYYCEPSVWVDASRLQPDDHGFATDDDRPLVFCSLGTQPRNYQQARSVLGAIIEAFADLPDHRLLIAASGLFEAFASTPVPANVRLVASVPQLSVLEQASMIITHGGIGTLKEAIMAAVPMVVIPFMFDQPANARRVEYHGIGRSCLPSSCTPARLRDLVREVSRDEALRQRVATFSAIFREYEARCPAGQLLLELLSQGRRTMSAR